MDKKTLPWEEYKKQSSTSAEGPWKDYQTQAAPSAAKAPAKEKTTGERVFEFVEPSVEALGTAGGATLGSSLGPLGTVGGAGLGYGISREAMRLAKLGLGYEKPRTTEQLFIEPAKDILIGGSMEAGGRGIIEPAVRFAGKGVGSLLGRVGDIGAGPELRAAKIARESLGQDLPKARDILSKAADDISASQALATIDPSTGKAMLNAPVAQALLERAMSRDPRFFTNLFGAQQAQRFNTLSQIARGGDETAAREAREMMKKDLNERLIPTLKTELEAANIAGVRKPALDTEAARMREAAASKVEDVKRFVAAEPRAEALARLRMVEKNLPVGAAKYTYLGELGKRADEVASQAAEGSLRFGDAARFAEAASASLEAHGLRPLESAPIIQSIRGKIADPSLAGNRDVQRVLSRVEEDLTKWTNSGGVIDAFALDSIRKNSVNSAIRELYPQASIKSQKELAASLLESVRPLIIDAVERAGGTGYRSYLEAYALGSKEIAETKLGAEALRLYQTAPKQFVQLVEGNAPEVVEQIFGPGKYNIAKQMSKEAMDKLGIVARDIKREEAIGEQAAAGTQALGEILKDNISKFKLPAFFSPKITTANRILDVLETKLNRNTLAALTEAAKDARSLNDLLGKMPARERIEFLQVMQNPETYRAIQSGAAPVIAGVSQRKSRTSEALEPRGAGGITRVSPRLP